MATWKNIIKLPNKEIVAMVNDDFKASDKARDRINQANLVCLKAFYALDWNQPFSAVPLANFDNNPLAVNQGAMDSKLRGNAFYPPFARSMILSYLAHMVAGVFPSNEQWLQGIAQEGHDEASVEGFIQTARHLYREIDYKAEGILAILQALVMDVSVVYVGWKVEPDYVPVKFRPKVQMPDEKTGEMIDTNQEADKDSMRFEYTPQAKSEPDIFTVNTFNLKVDPHAIHGNLNRSNPLFLGLTHKMSKAEFHRRAEAGMFSEASISKGGKLKIRGHGVIPDDEPCGGDGGDSAMDYQKILMNDLKTGDGQQEGEDDDNHYRVNIYFQKFGHVVTINDEYVAHKEQTKGWMFRVVRSHTVMGRFSGHPAMADLIHLQHDITTMSRSRRDRQDDDAYPKKIVNVAYFRSADEAYNAASGDDPVVVVDGSKADMGDTSLPPISLLEHQHPYDSTLKETQFGMQYAEEVLGMPGTSRGASGGGGASETATKTTKRHEGGATRMGMMIGDFRKELVQGVTYDLWMLIQQYSSREYRFRVAGVPGGVRYVKYTKDDFLFNTPPEIRVIGQGQVDDMMTDAQVFMNAMGLVMGNPATAQLLKLSPHLFTLYRKLGIDNPEDLLLADKPVDFMIPPEMEIRGLIAGIEIPLSQLNDAQEHFDAITEFMDSEEYGTIDDGAKARLSKRAEEYGQLLQGGQQGGQVGATPPGGAGTSAMGGMMTGGANAGGSPNPAAMPAAGQVNQMKAGPPAPGG